MRRISHHAIDFSRHWPVAQSCTYICAVETVSYWDSGSGKDKQVPDHFLQTAFLLAASIIVSDQESIEMPPSLPEYVFNTVAQAPENLSTPIELRELLSPTH
jgi:hypothetical protein